MPDGAPLNNESLLELILIYISCPQLIQISISVTCQDCIQYQCPTASPFVLLPWDWLKEVSFYLRIEYMNMQSQPKTLKHPPFSKTSLFAYIFCSVWARRGKLLEISPLYYYMKSHIIQRSHLPSPSRQNSPNHSFYSAKFLQKPLLTVGNPHLSHSHRQLMPRQQSQKLQKDLSSQLISTYNSERNSPVKPFFRRRKAQESPLQASEQLPSKKFNLVDLMACSDPPLFTAKARESFSTQPPSCKSASDSPHLREYKMLKRIGEGRFGSVYLAVHRRTGFVGAMKVLRKRDIASCPADKRDKIKAQIISEIKIQSFLDHPNLVRLYDCFADRAHLYLFVELGCEGHLYELLKRNRKVSEEAISIVVREVARGIAYMHSQNVLHRDIKLENIVFTHGMAKICDLGWAVYQPQELRTTLCGTPLYLAPEMLKGKSYSSKVDLWALGTLTHELLTNENPFKITNQKQLRKILTEEVSMTVGSPEIRSFISFVLNKNPERRPDAEIVLMHPFVKKYEEIQTSEETCCLTRMGQEP